VGLGGASDFPGGVCGLAAYFSGWGMRQTSDFSGWGAAIDQVGAGEALGRSGRSGRRGAAADVVRPYVIGSAPLAAAAPEMGLTLWVRGARALCKPDCSEHGSRQPRGSAPPRFDGWRFGLSRGGRLAPAAPERAQQKGRRNGRPLQFYRWTAPRAPVPSSARKGLAWRR